MSEGLLQKAIQLTRASKRAEARGIVLQVVQVEEHNVNAWLLLSVLLEDVSEQILALENVLYLNPKHQKARGRLHQLLLKEAISAVKINQLEAAENLLYRILEADQNNESAWLWLSRALVDLYDQIEALQHALDLNPDNPDGWERLEALRQLTKDPFAPGSYYQSRGELKMAQSVYERIYLHSWGSKKERAFQKLNDLGMLSEEAVGPKRQIMTWLRLATGPTLLFFILSLIHAGIDFRQLPPLLILWVVLIFFGSMLISAVQLTPNHPLWIRIWGVRGLDSFRRAWLWGVGALLVTTPYFLLLVNAWKRLTLIQIQ